MNRDAERDSALEMSADGNRRLENFEKKHGGRNEFFQKNTIPVRFAVLGAQISWKKYGGTAVETAPCRLTLTRI
jgi:hypothetical protein